MFTLQMCMFWENMLFSAVISCIHFLQRTGQRRVLVSMEVQGVDWLIKTLSRAAMHFKIHVSAGLLLSPDITMFHQSSCIFEEMYTIIRVLQLLLASKVDIKVLSGQARPGLRVGILSTAELGQYPLLSIFNAANDLNRGQTGSTK